MTPDLKGVKVALERVAWIVEASPASFNCEGRLGRIGDIARFALQALEANNV